MPTNRPWEEVAKFAAFGSQIESLGLMPWQTPPCCADMRALSQPYGDPGGKHASPELALRMAKAGVSRWSPTPSLPAKRRRIKADRTLKAAQCREISDNLALNRGRWQSRFII